MITISNLINNNLFINLSGTVTHHDYEHTLVPAISDISNQYQNINVAVSFTQDFKGIAFNALIDDALLGIKYWNNWHKIAFINEPKWLHSVASTFEGIMPFSFDFLNGDLAAELWFKEDDYF